VAKDSEAEGQKASPGQARLERILPIALAVVVGIAAGIGSYTFRYAEGLSYLSTDPKACVNCHIMRPEYDGWQKSSHHQVAVCVDCHLPHSFIAKYLVKAENGWRHGKMFTLQNFDEPITVKAKGRAVLQENCLGCHGALVHGIVAMSDPARGDELTCTHCHSGVGHGEKAGIGGPLTLEELRADRDQRRMKE
jgi:cytochrome c nitrite reductase small subunit